jgi:GNAT superfamily N-acetyltransferase
VANVLSAETLRKLDDFWARQIGCAPHILCDQRELIVALPAKDGSEFARVFRRGACRITTCSPKLAPALERADRSRPTDVDDGAFLTVVLGGRISKLISQVVLLYADTQRPQRTESRARLLRAEELPSLNTLRGGVSDLEWEHSSLHPSQPLAGCFVEHELVAAAGYEVWGGEIAHIGVATAASHRGRGYGRDVVACIANQAIDCGLVAQYQTLGANAASMALADALGFCPYAEYAYAVVGQRN